MKVTMRYRYLLRTSDFSICYNYGLIPVSLAMMIAMGLIRIYISYKLVVKELWRRKQTSGADTDCVKGGT